MPIPETAAKIRLGMLTPSSNTVVEPVTADIVRTLPGVSAHFSRFTVTEISLAQQALDQFQLPTFLAAAQLLADARMHVIAWNGTSAAWKGFDQDTALCEQITNRFGVPATASMLALNQILSKTAARRFALVTPYNDEVQRKIIDNYQASGFRVIAERHSGISENFAFSEIAPEDITAMARAAMAESRADAAEKPQALMIVCTNLNAAPLVDELERELGIPVYDSTSAVIWHSLRLAGVDTSPVQGWGRLFGENIL